MNKRYPPEFKADVVKLALSGDVPKRQIAEDVGISETTLFRWWPRTPDPRGPDGRAPAPVAPRRP